MSELNRYGLIKEKNPREILLLRGRGCAWKRCRFCDYHLDASKDEKENFLINRPQLRLITGIYQKLEVINSGSFVDLDLYTIKMIKDICVEKGIKEVHFESHWMHRKEIAGLKDFFGQDNIVVKIKIGVETFDTLFRESYLVKGIETDSPEEIAIYFDEVCLLQGLPGQTKASMETDIETGLTYFERVCVNIMEENTMPIRPDPSVIHIFLKEIYPKYKDNDRVDILLENTDFGVGGVARDEK